ncbi:MAG: T9SS type A sorting domain-containing protein [Cryomorphaceae bacterium]|nr:T9SS type A sorting domain-containing protein [Flavobacteriales bacterium]
MIIKIILTASMMACITLASAQGQHQTGNAMFFTSKPTAEERGMKLLEEQRNFNFPEKSIIANQKTKAKSASNFSARLDSLVSDAGIKLEWTFDEHGNNTFEKLSLGSPEESWTDQRQIDITYDEEDLPIERITMVWSISQLELQQDSRETFTYQEDGLMAETIEYDWYSDVWMPDTKYVFEYDEQDNLSEVVRFQWDAINEGFEEFGKEDYTYNETGGLLEFRISNRVANEWVNSAKETYTLDSDDNTVLAIISFWQVLSETWYPVYSDEYTYNSDGLEIEVVNFSWSAAVEDFTPDAKTVRVYNDSDKLLSEEFFFWSNQDSGWQPGYLDTFDYDEAGNRDVIVNYEWDENSQDYLPFDMFTGNFNNDYPVSDIMLPELLIVDGIDHMPLASSNYFYQSGEWVEETNEELYYTFFDVTSVKDVSGSPFAVYPNPFRESIRFNQPLQRFTLYDLQGRVVMQKQLTGAVEVNAGHLPAGIYVYQVESSNSVQTGKLVRE